MLTDKIQTYAPYIILAALVFGMSIAMYQMNDKIEYQNDRIINMTYNDGIYEKVFVTQQTMIIENQVDINQTKANTDVQVQFNIEVGTWAEGIEERLERLESQR